jgi:hypothetical protein
MCETPMTRSLAAQQAGFDSDSRFLGILPGFCTE